MDDEQNTIDEQRDHVADQRKANEAVQRSLQVSQSSAKELQAYLDRPENQARVRRLMELDQEIDHQNQENRSAEKACVRLETELENSAEAITRRKENLLNATIDEQDQSAISGRTLSWASPGWMKRWTWKSAPGRR